MMKHRVALPQALFSFLYREQTLYLADLMGLGIVKRKGGGVIAGIDSSRGFQCALSNSLATEPKTPLTKEASSVLP